MLKIPDTTVGKVALIAGGNLVTEELEASQLLSVTFDASDYPQALLGYPAQQRFIDGLYEIFRNCSPDSPTRKRCFQALREAGGKTGYLPTSCHFPFTLQKPDATPNAAGGRSNVWRVSIPDGTVFALKVLHVTEQDDFLEIKKRFCEEIVVAKQVKHENVLAIKGVQMSEGYELRIVSEWMESGNLHAYIRENGNSDRVELMLGVTTGLSYLHSVEIIHGDLKSPNVLIGPNGVPRLTDFGVSSITGDVLSANTPVPFGSGSIRWRAPELLALSTKAKGQNKTRPARPTYKSDVYSLAMVVIEIFTGTYPFDGRNDGRVIYLLGKGSRPEKPDHDQFTPEMWSLTQKCWNKDPERRPDASGVLEKLESLESGGGKSRPKWYQSIKGSVSALRVGSRLSLGLRFGEGSSTAHLS